MFNNKLQYNTLLHFGLFGSLFPFRLVLTTVNYVTLQVYVLEVEL